MKKLFLPVIIILLIAACEKDQITNDPPPPPPTSDPIPTGMVGSTVEIGALGGEVVVPSPNGSISLTVPPGALSSPTEITVYTPEQSEAEDIRLAFEPDGLEFLVPARLNVALSQDLFDTYALTSLWNISELNDLVDVGSEEHRWEHLDNIEIGSSGQSISGEMDHFSTGFVLLGIQRVAYMVIDLPGKYLRPGDALFVMSGGSTLGKYHWIPGHVGLVNCLDPDDGTRDGNLQVLESTIKGGALENVNGVQTNPFLLFKRSHGHVYMGARRPTILPVVFTDAQRLTAMTFARSKLGQGYGYLGGIIPNRWTCSELVEAAWDAAGVGVFTPGLEFFPSPVESFEKTNRVTEISVRVGEEVEIPIYPVVIDKSSNTLLSTGFYLAGNPAVGATMTLGGGAPPGSGWAVDNLHVYKANTFTWTPKASDAGTTVRVNFGMTGAVTLDAGVTKGYTIIKFIDIKVRGANTTIQVTPVQMGQTGLTYVHYFPIPAGAVIGPNSQDHLIDLATGAYPVNPIFTEQILDDYVEEWSNPVTMTHYGVRFHLSRLDFPFNPAPPGSHNWSYSVDYELPFYTGLEDCD